MQMMTARRLIPYVHAGAAIALLSALLTAPASAQMPCTTLTRYGVPSPATATSSAASVQSATAWLRQFRTHGAAADAMTALRLDLPAILTVQHSNDSVGWARFRELLDTFPARDASVMQRYHPAIQQLHASTAGLLAQCLAIPGLKVWLEHTSPREFAIAARYDGARSSDDLSIDRLIYDRAKLVCDNTLSTESRSGVLARGNRAIGNEIRRETCQRRVPDEMRIVVTAKEDPVGGSTLVVPSGDPIDLTPTTIAATSLRFTPPHTKGDRQFGSNGPVIRAEAWLETDATRRHLYLRLEMHAAEGGRDKTTAHGVSPMTEEFRVYTAIDGHEIASFATVRDTMEARTDNNEPIAVQAGQGWGKRGVGGILSTNHGIIESWEVTGKTRGEDAGVGTHVRIATLPLLVKVRRSASSDSAR